MKVRNQHFVMFPFPSGQRLEIIYELDNEQYVRRANQGFLLISKSDFKEMSKTKLVNPYPFEIEK